MKSKPKHDAVSTHMGHAFSGSIADLNTNMMQLKKGGKNNNRQ